MFFRSHMGDSGCPKGVFRSLTADNINRIPCDINCLLRYLLNQSSSHTFKDQWKFKIKELASDSLIVCFICDVLNGHLQFSKEKCNFQMNYSVYFHFFPFQPFPSSQIMLQQRNLP